MTEQADKDLIEMRFHNQSSIRGAHERLAADTTHSMNVGIWVGVVIIVISTISALVILYG